MRFVRFGLYDKHRIGGDESLQHSSRCSCGFLAK